MKKLMILLSALIVTGMSVMTQAKELVFSDDVHKLYENQITTDLLTNENETLEVSIDRHVKETDEFLVQVKDEIKRNEKFRTLLPSYLMKAVGGIATTVSVVSTVLTELFINQQYEVFDRVQGQGSLVQYQIYNSICATSFLFRLAVCSGILGYVALKYGHKYATKHQEYGQNMQDLLDRGNQIISELNVIKENSVLVAE